MEARFPENPGEIPVLAVSSVAQQVKVPAEEWAAYDWSGRAIKRHRVEIRGAFGFRECTAEDQAQLAEWLTAELCGVELNRDRLAEAVVVRWRGDRMEPPTPGRVARLVGSAVTTFEERCCTATVGRLSAATRCGGAGQGLPQAARQILGRGLFSVASHAACAGPAVSWWQRMALARGLRYVFRPPDRMLKLCELRDRPGGPKAAHARRRGSCRTVCPPALARYSPPGAGSEHRTPPEVRPGSATRPVFHGGPGNCPAHPTTGVAGALGRGLNE
ncbi:DUF4158 domain-containing protein [Streptomyces sp. OfavH-34-F]|uniref:DUF4158 domain-containing protein n=1 Tax=Streptomyces sp. OfavH-34-F TaxID=2917760 RepID=UPI0035AE2D9C